MKVDFAVIEIVIFIVSISFILYFLKSPFMFKAIVLSALTSISLEIVNEKAFEYVGTNYPGSLIFFPFFKFPVAIVLLSVFYSGVINLIALKISELSKYKFLSIFLFVISILFLNGFSIFVEKGGIYLKYWKHLKAADVTIIFWQVYLFYFTVVAAGSVFIIRESLKRFKRFERP
ncbi:MAG: hypothetical protein ACOX2F_11000 [bacterium]